MDITIYLPKHYTPKLDLTDEVTKTEEIVNPKILTVANQLKTTSLGGMEPPAFWSSETFDIDQKNTRELLNTPSNSSHFLELLKPSEKKPPNYKASTLCFASDIQDRLSKHPLTSGSNADFFPEIQTVDAINGGMFITKAVAFPIKVVGAAIDFTLDAISPALQQGVHLILESVGEFIAKEIIPESVHNLPETLERKYGILPDVTTDFIEDASAITLVAATAGTIKLCSKIRMPKANFTQDFPKSMIDVTPKQKLLQGRSSQEIPPKLSSSTFKTQIVDSKAIVSTSNTGVANVPRPLIDVTPKQKLLPNDSLQLISSALKTRSIASKASVSNIPQVPRLLIDVTPKQNLLLNDSPQLISSAIEATVYSPPQLSSKPESLFEQIAKGDKKLSQVLSYEKQYLDKVCEEMDKIPLDPELRSSAYKAAIESIDDLLKEDRLEDYIDKHKENDWQYENSWTHGLKLDNGVTLIQKAGKGEDRLSVIRHLHFLKKAKLKESTVPEVLGTYRRRGVFLTQMPGVTVEEFIKTAAQEQRYDDLNDCFLQMGRAHAELNSLLKMPIPAQEQIHGDSLLKIYTSLEKKLSDSQMTLPHTLDEIKSLVRDFEKTPQIVVFAHDDPRLRNAMWDPKQKHFSFIDIGGFCNRPHLQLSMDHPARYIYSQLRFMKRTFDDHKIPEAVQKSCFASFSEGYHAIAQEPISSAALQVFQLIDLYDSLDASILYELAVRAMALREKGIAEKKVAEEVAEEVVEEVVNKALRDLEFCNVFAGHIQEAEGQEREQINFTQKRTF